MIYCIIEYKFDMRRADRSNFVSPQVGNISALRLFSFEIIQVKLLKCETRFVRDHYYRHGERKLPRNEKDLS